MANLYFQVSPENLYSTGYIVELPDGRLLLKRNKVEYSPTADKDITHVVRDNDRIWDMSFRYYQKDLQWGVIADVNNVYNPFELEPGSEFIIPDLEQSKLQTS